MWPDLWQLAFVRYETLCRSHMTMLNQANRAGLVLREERLDALDAVQRRLEFAHRRLVSAQERATTLEDMIDEAVLSVRRMQAAEAGARARRRRQRKATRG